MNAQHLDTLLDISAPVEAEVVEETSALVPVATPEAPNTTISTVESSNTAVTPVKTEDTRLESDFEYARTKVRDVIDTSRDALDSAILLAKSGDSPRAYEVVATLLSALVQANKDLVAIHKGKVDAQPKSQAEASTVDGGSPVNIERAVFVGRAQDLLREIREMAKAPKEVK